ncbi:MAG: protein kinase [Planctomycetes bacterium]|nr:protein kinase [Planctomycetota bacterium]
MQIRCATCTRTIAIAPTGELPPLCPHCTGACLPAQLGPFVPVRLIATGGMGEVYLARHRELGTEVAIKLLPAMPLEAASAVRERFAREARLTAKVQHPGVVKVLASDVAGDRPYLVLELVFGETLRQRLARGPMSIAEAARAAAATADVLAAAHAEGVLHRDIKPDNVMLSNDGSVRVLDFGIARAMSDEAPLTRTGEILGTPEYMAPEQLLFGPEATDARTDVHALGVLLYELLTQRSPVHGANLFQALKLVESLVPPAPSSLRAEVPKALDEVVLRALQKRPEDRTPTAFDFANAVRTAVPAARPAKAAPPAAQSRWLWYLFLPVATIVVLGTIGLLLLKQGMERTLDHVMNDPELRQSLKTVLSPLLSPLQRAEEIEHQIAKGQWIQAMTAAEHADPTTGMALDYPIFDVFARTQLAWPIAAGLPRWFAASDESRRRRIFGDGLEPAGGALTLPMAWTMQDDAQAREEMLRELHQPDDALATLLAIPALPPEQRADAFGAYAQRLPLDAPEHWLACMLERHLRGDAAGRTQAAEMAWLQGAGELAVLMEAGLAVLQPRSDGPTRPRTASQEVATSRRRTSAALAGESPASHLFGLLCDAMQQPAASLDLGAARSFPVAQYPHAPNWFVAAARQSPDRQDSQRREALLLVAVALGARPDYTISPWRDLPNEARATLDAEAQRGR